MFGARFPTTPAECLAGGLRFFMSSTTATLRQSFEKRFVNPKHLRRPGFESIELLEDCSNRDTAANRREFERRMKLRACTRAIPIDAAARWKCTDPRTAQRY